MTQDQVLLVQRSFEKLLPQTDLFARLVYIRLFDRHPELRPLFKGDMARQRAKLMITLATVVHGLKNEGAIVPILEEHGRRHVGYGVRVEHYPLLGEAILWAIAQTLEHEFSADVGTAWREAYALMADAMIQGAKTPSGWGRIA